MMKVYSQAQRLLQTAFSDVRVFQREDDYKCSRLPKTNFYYLLVLVLVATGVLDLHSDFFKSLPDYHLSCY